MNVIVKKPHQFGAQTSVESPKNVEGSFVLPFQHEITGVPEYVLPDSMTRPLPTEPQELTVP